MDDLRYAPPERRLASDPGLTRMIEAHDLTRDYPMPAGVVHALRDVNLQVGRGQLVALRGRSGSGKTTFLSLV
ncbi:MAG TPA: ATP-binding cassette domain-containing protein, partial [Candidatus Binatus sp.]|nr:ATP-binding cassette domain-containing protein [Candidatus Binatus sp.]